MRARFARRLAKHDRQMTKANLRGLRPGVSVVSTAGMKGSLLRFQRSLKVLEVIVRWENGHEGSINVLLINKAKEVN